MGAVTDTSTFESLNPATGEMVGTHPVRDAQAVQEHVDAAREAARWWAGLGFRERRARLLGFKSLLVRNLDQVAQRIHEETGKPIGDATLETMITVVHVDWAAKNAQRVLGRRRVSGGIMGVNMAATVAYEPLGVIGVIGPWNYPLFTPMGSIVYALAAGNAVVFKPSEFTPGVAVLAAELLRKVIPEFPVLSVVTGFGETGAALCRSGVDKVAFTGSAATAKRVMAACAESLTPIVAECGGKDALIVDSSADLRAAAESALWGAVSNAGQTCVGVERVYVLDEVYDRFLTQLSDQTAKIKAGEQYGPMTMPSQLGVIQRHIDDAVERGGKPILGGSESVREPYVDPVILTDVPDDSAAVREETFGPTVVVNRVSSLDEAVRRANESEYGLAGTVFARSKQVAMDVADRMKTGMVAINSIISFAGIPALPFGGIGASGFGRIHGADGLREFARSKAVARQRFALPGNPPTSFRRTQRDLDRLVKLFKLLHGR